MVVLFGSADDSKEVTTKVDGRLSWPLLIATGGAAAVARAVSRRAFVSSADDRAGGVITRAPAPSTIGWILSVSSWDEAKMGGGGGGEGLRLTYSGSNGFCWEIIVEIARASS